MGAVSASSALLLADNADTRVYFQPNANWNGTVSAGLTIKAWDQTEGTVNTMASTSFSADTDTVALTVAPANDAPVASGSATLAAIAEDTASPAGASISSLWICP